MKFLNETPYPTALLRTAHPSPHSDALVNSLVVRVRHRLVGTQLAAPEADDQPAQLEREIPAGYGVLHEDPVYPRSGTDVIVIGDAVPPQPTTHMRVHIEAGPYAMELAVFGDRVWQRQHDTLVASAPAVFERMPLTLHHAFGGAAPSTYGDIPNPDNPDGKGYYLAEDDAVGNPLPNIEDPDHPIRVWNDAPEPVGCSPYPPSGRLRSSRTMEVTSTASDPPHATLELVPKGGLFDSAHPRLSGTPWQRRGVRIRGMAGSREIAFEVPPCPVEALVEIGDRGGRRVLALEEVLINTLSSTVDLTFRKTFHYVPKQYETRRTTVKLAGSRS